MEIDDEYEIIGTGNRYMDMVLGTLIANEETGTDPYSPKEYILAMPFVEAYLYNGCVTGLKTLHRAGRCFITKTYRRLHILADVGANDVNIDFEAVILLKWFSVKFSLNLHFRHIRVETNFCILTNSARCEDLYNFQILETHGIFPTIAICKPLDWLFNIVIRTTVWFWNAPFKRLLSAKINGEIQDKMPFFQFPVMTESSETIQYSQNIGQSSEEDNERSLIDEVQSEDNTSATRFSTTLEEFGDVKSRNEEFGHAFLKDLTFHMVMDEFRKRLASYKIL